MPLVIEGMKGLGDNIYQRAVVRAAASRGPVFLETPWPELYADLPVKFLRTDTALRTQRGNVERQSKERWSARPIGASAVRVSYGANITSSSIIKAMERVLPLDGQPLVLDLPNFGPCPVNADKPIAVVRPVTVRKEWRNEARNPRPEYVAQIAASLMDDYHVVSVADLAEGAEWLLDPVPPAHTVLHRGELAVGDLLSLVRHAALVVGGVGWLVPAAVAAKVPGFFVLGGQGGHNAPERITDPRMDLSRIGWAMPDNYCRCTNMKHADCDKRIGDVMDQFEGWRRGQGL